VQFGEILVTTLAASLLGGVLSFASTTLLVRYLIPILKNRGISGSDAHKPNHPEIPEMGGIGLMVGVFVGVIPIVLVFPEWSHLLLTFMGCTLISGVIGLVDDLHPLRSWQKPLLLMIPALLIYTIMYVFPVFWPRLFLPIVGWTRLTIVYPLLIPLAFSVCGNTVNMMDVFNGTMTGSMSIIFGVLAIASFFLGLQFGLIASMLMLGGVIGLYYWNRYPSKVFVGDTGALIIGSGLACIAIMGGLEVIAVISLLPFIMNSFHSIVSVGGLFERREMKTRPIQLSEITTEEGKKQMILSANPDPKAPLTLTRLILANSSLTEKELVRGFLLLTIFSGILSLTTVGLILFMGV
jgi:UDP-N-acetylglucosamine--dolichyl-phosphate N-acetylglucosaminephosphotransferase